MEGQERDVKRCPWANPENLLYLKYHDEEWGRPVHDDGRLLELLILESFQAGLSWECVLNKREAFRKAFAGFDRDIIIAFDETKIEELMTTPGIIHNRRKIQAAVSNTVVFKAIQEEFGSFDAYISRFCPTETIYDHTSTTSSISDALSADLRKRGMKFVGSTIIHAFLQSIGVFNSHHPDCFLHCGTPMK